MIKVQGCLAWIQIDFQATLVTNLKRGQEFKRTPGGSQAVLLENSNTKGMAK